MVSYLGKTCDVSMRDVDPEEKGTINANLLSESEALAIMQSEVVTCEQAEEESQTDESAPEFTQAQLHSIIDMAVLDVATRVGAPADVYSEVAEKTELAVPCDPMSHSGTQVFSRMQVRQILEFIAESCAKIQLDARRRV